MLQYVMMWYILKIMPQLLHFLKVDHGTQINKLKCLDSTAPPSTNAPSDSQPSEKDVFVNATDEVGNAFLSVFF